MTEQSLIEGIKRLIIARRNANNQEQQRINAKLDKLYEIKYLMLQQKQR